MAPGQRMITVHVLMKRHLVAQAQSEKSRFGGMIVFVGANALFFNRFVILSVKGFGDHRRQNEPLAGGR